MFYCKPAADNSQRFVNMCLQSVNTNLYKKGSLFRDPKNLRFFFGFYKLLTGT